MSHEELVRRHDRDGVATIELHRPERRNALIGPMFDQLAGHTEAAAADDSVHAVVLCGAGGAFCSGLDLDAYNQDPPPDWLATSADSLRRAHVALATCEAPIVVALERYAINGGAAFALAGDLVVVGEGAWLQVGEVRQGAMAPMNLAWQVGRYPRSTVNQVVLRGDRLGSARLRELGVAHEVVADESVLWRAEEIAQELASFPPGAARGMKRAVDQLERGLAEQDAMSDWFERAAAVAGQPGRFQPRRHDEYRPVDRCAAIAYRLAVAKRPIRAAEGDR